MHVAHVIRKFIAIKEEFNTIKVLIVHEPSLYKEQCWAGRPNILSQITFKSMTLIDINKGLKNKKDKKWICFQGIMRRESSCNI